MPVPRLYPVTVRKHRTPRRRKNSQKEARYARDRSRFENHSTRDFVHGNPWNNRHFISRNSRSLIVFENVLSTYVCVYVCVCLCVDRETEIFLAYSRRVFSFDSLDCALITAVFKERRIPAIRNNVRAQREERLQCNQREERGRHSSFNSF